MGQISKCRKLNNCKFGNMKKAITSLIFEDDLVFMFEKKLKKICMTFGHCASESVVFTKERQGRLPSFEKNCM